jgi:uncharacterized protein with GYD domain
VGIAHAVTVAARVYDGSASTPRLGNPPVPPSAGALEFGIAPRWWFARLPAAPAAEEEAMPRYVELVHWTEQGITNVKDTIQRAEAVKRLVASMGGEMTELLWTQGRYDLVGIMTAPDDETAAAIGLAIGRSGAVRTETLRAFDANEMATIVAKLK